MLKWNLLWMDRTTFAAFQVTKDGTKIPYKGLTVKPGPPTKDDWYNVAPGGKYKATIRISDLYDLSARGKYKIYYEAYCNPFGVGSDILRSNVVEFAK